MISLLWLLPAVCHTLDIPLQAALLIGGAPVGFTNFTALTQRQKRSVTKDLTCREDEYQPPDTNHCCNKCLEGYKVVSHCSGEGMKSNCSPCEEGYYNKYASGSTSCIQCGTCLTNFDQVELQNCTATSDTVCGCPGGHYQHKSAIPRKFTCQPCRTCENGRELKPCTAEHDTLCTCIHDFYLDPSGSCSPCRECQDTDDCTVHCPPTSIKPEETNMVPLILAGVPAVILVAVLTAVIIKKRQTLKKYISAVQTKHPLPATDTSGSSQLSEPLMEISTSTAKLDYLPGHTVCVIEDPELPQQNTALPLPDITLQTTTPCLSSPEFLYKVIECIPVSRWREFVRRLGVNNNVIESSEHDYRPYKDAQYAMLSFWVHNAGSSGATMDTLFKVLREMNLGGCIERIEESL